MKVGVWSRTFRGGVLWVCVLVLVGSIASETLAQRGGRGSGRGGGRGFGPPLGQGSEPAAVPEVVAIPRPSKAEIEQARQLLAQLKEFDSQARALLKKYPDLIAVQPPRANTAIVPSLARFFEAKHNANLEVAEEGDVDLLLMGDSITDFWRNESGRFAGKPVLDEYFGGVKVANFGIAGDTTQGVLYRLENGEGEGFSPKAVMLMIGTNNTGRNTAAEIAEGIGAVVLQLRKHFPDAKILLLGVFPRGGVDAPVRDTINEVNEIISRLNDDEHVFYLDIGDKFLDADGNIPPDVMSDGLHPSTKGYEIWAEAVKGPLAELMGVETLAAEPVTFSREEDHQNMMEQLGITRLRPGPSGRPNAPNPANYDESIANPYPELPEVLTLKNGKKVTTPEQWWQQRRPEIVEDFEREVLGRIPENVPEVKWEVRETREATVGETPVIEKHIVGVVDNSACPSIEVNISMSLTTPKNADGPVPVLMMFGRTPFDGPPAGFFGRGGRRGRGAGGNRDGQANRRGVGRQGRGAARGRRGGFGFGGQSRQQLIDAGWGYAMISPGSIQADNGAGLTRGIIGLTNLGQPRKPDDWGSLRAWGWGASRGLDYLETDPAVDPKKVGIEGVSRYGKAALVTMAFDPRFAMVLVGSSGEGGASLYRRHFGEAVENLTGRGEYHWMAGNFLKYGTDQSPFGSMNPGDLPVDSHELIALCAPRLTFISYGIPERGDAHWLDHQGSYMAAVAAGPVFRLLGAKDLGTPSDDYMTEKMPPVNEGLVDGHLAWRQHDGGHTDAPNIPHFIRWADRMLGRTAAAAGTSSN